MDVKIQLTLKGERWLGTFENEVLRSMFGAKKGKVQENGE
jgi:hypothetical protein